VRSNHRLSSREKNDRLNIFYNLEEHAKNKKVAGKTFLIYEGRHWTYKETYETVLKYGTFFKSTLAVKPEQIVAVDFMNSERFIFIWFGLWSIGARPAFINYNLTGKALAHCVRVSTATRCIVDPEVEDRVTQEVRDELPNVEFTAYTPELEAEILSMQAHREPDSVRSGNTTSSLAMLIYTSGTTGLPKPAVVSWQKIIMTAALIGDWGRLRSDDIVYTVS